MISLRDYIREPVDETYESFEGSRPARAQPSPRPALKSNSEGRFPGLDFYGTIDIGGLASAFLA